MPNMTVDLPRINKDTNEVSLVISGDVLDENGTRIGDFLKICEKAVSAWERELVAAGINIPIP